MVATASYEARAFGVHSAMPMGRARRLCPGARYIRPRMARYREKSAEVFSTFRAFSPMVEGLSPDDALLDVADPIYVLTYLFELTPEPLDPFPEAGLDPTDGDPYGCLDVDPE